MTSTHQVAWRNPDWYCHGVLDGRLGVQRIFENDQALGFFPPAEHRRTKYDFHAVVIPTRHVTTLLDLGPDDGELLTSVIDAIQGTARALHLPERGFFVRANVMPPYQGTGHIHLHLLSGKRSKNSGKGKAKTKTKR